MDEGNVPERRLSLKSIAPKSVSKLKLEGRVP